MSSSFTGSIWAEHENDEKACFSGMLQGYTDKTANTLKANATVAYPMHVALLNFTKEYFYYLVNHEHTSTVLLPLPTAVQVDYEKSVDEENVDAGKAFPLLVKLPETSDKDGRDVPVCILHRAV